MPSRLARAMRKNPTWAEKLVWRWLKDRRFTSYKFRRQHPFGPYTLDFFCTEANLSIELDGSQHGFPEQHNHDKLRKQFLEARGVMELRFWNSHLRNNPQSVRETLFRILQERAPHPLPNYTHPVPHPNPLPEGEGATSNTFQNPDAFQHLNAPPNTKALRRQTRRPTSISQSANQSDPTSSPSPSGRGPG